MSHCEINQPKLIAMPFAKIIFHDSLLLSGQMTVRTKDTEPKSFSSVSGHN